MRKGHDLGAIESLAAKLDTLDLTDGEQAVLDALVERAAEGGDDVVGFLATESPGSHLDGTAFKLGMGVGVVYAPPDGFSGRHTDDGFSSLT